MKITGKNEKFCVEVLTQQYPNMQPDGIGEVVAAFRDENKDYDFDTKTEIKCELISFAHDFVGQPFDEIDNKALDLNYIESVFCEVYLRTNNASEAYAASHPDCTDNPDSVRSLASRFIRRPAVVAYITAARQRVKQSAIEHGIWSREQSLLARREMFDAFNADLKERKERLQGIIEAIQSDETLSPADKAQRIIQATSRPIIGKDTIEAHKAICDSLDALTFTNDNNKSSWYEIGGEAANSWGRREQRRIEHERIEQQTKAILPDIFNP